MMKRIVSAMLCLAMVAMMMPAIALVPAWVSASPYVMPSHNGLTNNKTFIMGEGTDAQTTVKSDFRSSLSTRAFNLKYIMIHNTGTYVGTANAKNVHTNTNKTSTSAAWHYTVDNKEIYQGVPDNRFAGHAGTSTNPVSSSNSIGIEMCVNNFPATETFGGEKWSDGDAIMAWYENQFNQTMKNTAYLVAVLCERHGLNYKTAVKQHYDAQQYGSSGKDCPMQMRATYNPDTNKFTPAGQKKAGRDGYFWQVFWYYLEQYAAGAKTVDSPLDPKQTVSFDSNGGSAVEPIKVKNGESIAAPAAPTRYGFNFAGWYCNPELTDPYTFGTPVPYDFTLFAKWDEAYWGANNNLMPNSTQLKLNDFNGQGEIWPYFNNDSYNSVTMYNGVTNDGNWSWPTAYMEYENSFDSTNDAYIYVKKDGNAQFNVMLTYMDKDGGLHDLMLSSVANLSETDFAAGYLEGFYNVGSYIRNIGHAPASGNVKFTRVTYYVIGEKDSYVKLYDLKFTSKFDIPDPYTSLMNSNIEQVSGVGSYNYNNGTLSMNATGNDGYSVKMNVNKTFNPTEMVNLLMDINTTAPFNVTMELTNGNGDATMELKNEFYNIFGLEGDFNALPAGAWNVDLHLLGYYEWNGGVIAESTVKSVTVTLMAPGSMTLKALQASRLEYATYVQDGGSSNGELKETPAVSGDLNGDGEMSTLDVRLVMLQQVGDSTLTDEQIVAGDLNGDGKVNTMDARMMLRSSISV